MEKSKGIKRRDLLKISGAAIGAMVLGRTGLSVSAPSLGRKIESSKLMTATAAFDPLRPEIARAVCESFNEIGFDAEPYPIEYTVNVQKVIREHDYDMWLVRLAGTAIRIDPDFHIYKVHHSSEYVKGRMNWTGYSNPELDRLAEGQQATMDLEKRRGFVYEAQKLIHSDQPSNFLVNPQMTQAHRSDRIKGLVPLMGEGIGSFWSDINMEVIKGDGYVKTGMTVPLKNFNPVAVVDTLEFIELSMIYDRLFRITPDGVPEPWAAESYRITSPTIIDITIRKGMKFHDGKEVTAEDVKFTLDYLKKWKAPHFIEQLDKIKDVELKGKYDLRVNMVSPYGPIIPALLATMFIIPKHIWEEIPEKVGVDDPLKFPNEKPIGSGPFKFDHWRRGVDMKVSRFKDHFRPPKCEGIIRVEYGSHDAMAAAIEKGECDRTRYILTPTLMEDLNKVPNVVGKGYPSHCSYMLSYHTRRPPFSDPAFRRALAHLVPKELIKDVIMHGHAGIGGSVIAPVNKFWHNPEVKPFPKDVDKAKRILKEAGYSWDKKGKLHYPL